MATGILLQGADGSVYFVPPDVLANCRLEGALLDSVRRELEVEPEVEGFADPFRYLGPFVLGPLVGQSLGGSVGTGSSSDGDAEMLKKQSATMDSASESLQPSRRRL